MTMGEFLNYFLETSTDSSSDSIKKMADEKCYTHFIAVDFGTAGCAVAIKIADESIPREIYVFQQWQTSRHSIKCPTIMLLDQKWDCVSFGLPAQKSYQRMTMKTPNEVNNFYLFEYFKMSLYKDKDNISQKLKVKTVDGKELPAVTVFSKALEHIKKITLKYLDEQVEHPNRSILWILTVPAIWSPAAKQVMRTAAEEAGFCTENDYVKLALEPEVASLYCIKEMEKLTSETSGHHLVVDCGGGTVDIAAHKWVKASPNTLQVDEIHKVHGGSCGSFAVNGEFEKLLMDILSYGTNISLSDIKQECGHQWSQLLYDDFDKSKCSFTNQEITICMPKSIHTYIKKKCGKTISELIKNYKTKWDATHNAILPEKICCYARKSGKAISEVCAAFKGLSWDDDEDAIVVPPGVMNFFFSPVIDQVIQMIEDVLSADAGKVIRNILMVGGFSKSTLLFNEVKHRFSSATITVNCVPFPDHAVLYGSIEFGKKHNVIKSRIMQLTLGIETWDDFKADKHDKEREYVDENGKSYCKHVFTKFVTIGESMSTEKSNSRRQMFTPVWNENNFCRVNIYGSYEKNPLYIDDHCVFLMGEIIIDDLPTASSGVSREVTVHMDVRGTEIVVTAVNNATSKKLPLKLDWMKEF